MRRLAGAVARGRGLPSERDWERAALLEPRLVASVPELVCDGGGLPFAPSALEQPAGGLDGDDPAVGALVAQLTARAGSKQGSRGAGKKGAPAPPPALSMLADWRLLARNDDEALFGRGRPPQLFTIAVRREGRDRGWKCIAESAARPLRATRDGIRASSWRPDPARELTTDDSVLRILVTEQTFASGRRADGRVQEPDLYLGPQELVLTVFVKPQEGFQARSPNPDTPVRIALPRAVGTRRLIDGALYEAEA